MQSPSVSYTENTPDETRTTRRGWRAGCDRPRRTQLLLQSAWVTAHETTQNTHEDTRFSNTLSTHAHTHTFTYTKLHSHTVEIP